MSNAIEFRKIVINGAISLGSTHALQQEISKDDREARRFFRASGGGELVELRDTDSNFATAFRYFLSEKESGNLAIENAGLVASYGIFGAPGSGKTVLLMQMLEQVLSMFKNEPDQRYGALILDPKAALISDVTRMAEAAGRLDDLVIINVDLLTAAGAGVNVIDTALDPHELGAVLVLAGMSAGVGASDPFWFQEWTNLFGSALGILRLHNRVVKRASRIPITLQSLLDSLLETADVPPDPGQNARGQPLGPPRKIVALAREMLAVSEKLDPQLVADLKADLQNLERFYRQEYVATVEAFLTRAYGMFRRSRLSCFSKHGEGAVPFYEDILERGKIVLVSIAPSEPLLAKTLSTLIKVLFQRLVLARAELKTAKVITNDRRPVVLACDEYAEIASEAPGQPAGDAQFLALARQYGCLTIFATQSVNMLMASGLRETWPAVFSNFAAKIYMRIADSETAESGSQLAGSTDWRVETGSSAISGGGMTSTQQFDIRERLKLPPAVLTQMLRVGEAAVIGSLDGGATPPGLFFLKVPKPKE